MFLKHESGMLHNFAVSITKENKWYVATALEFGVVSQGKTVEDAKKNIQEALVLYLEHEPAARDQLRKYQSTPLLTTVAVEYV